MLPCANHAAATRLRFGRVGTSLLSHQPVHTQSHSSNGSCSRCVHHPMLSDASTAPFRHERLHHVRLALAASRSPTIGNRVAQTDEHFPSLPTLDISAPHKLCGCGFANHRNSGGGTVPKQPATSSIAASSNHTHKHQHGSIGCSKICEHHLSTSAQQTCHVCNPTAVTARISADACNMQQ
jgi:hypothetical protein